MQRKTKKTQVYLTEVAITKHGKLIIGKRRIARYVKRSGTGSIVQVVRIDYAVLPFRQVVRDEKGKLRLTTKREAKAKGWR